MDINGITGIIHVIVVPAFKKLFKDMFPFKFLMMALTLGNPSPSP
jgi:hypothetical protein